MKNAGSVDDPAFSISLIFYFNELNCLIRQ